jgi:hypothetical protein
VSQNPIVQRIEAAAQGASVGRSSSHRSASTNLAQAEKEYRSGQAIVREAIRELIASLQSQKQSLLDGYSDQTLRKERQRFEGFADVFLAMATETSDTCYLFVTRTRDRKRRALDVSKAARNVAQHFESTWRGRKTYSMTMTAERIQKLIIALRNLDAQSG